MSTLSVGSTHLGVWDTAQGAVGFVGGLFGVAGLLDFGPLRIKPERVASEATAENLSDLDDDRSTDQLVRLAELRRSGEMSPLGFELAKKQIIGF
jgi:hypothetical protein